MKKVESYICPVCGNADPRYIGHLNGKPYCRRCISFRGEEAERGTASPKNAILDLKYALSPEQKGISEQVVKNYRQGIDTLVYAVCGSGKTEISYGIIGECVAKGLTVGFALPRRDVVVELFYRLKSAFPHNKVVAVYGGHTEEKIGDIIVLTTHQLYRYPKYFDLLVMDEIDAFPYKGNQVLIQMFRRSLRGHCVMMSATPSEMIRREFSQKGRAIVELNTRFHGQPIPVPKILVRPLFLKHLVLLKKLKEYQKRKKPCFVFVPSIGMARSLFRYTSAYIPQGNYVSSKRKKRPQIIEAFRKGRYSYLVTTAVLERGVTVKDIQVIVFHADSRIYNSATLIQISGRVGRKVGATDGDVWFLCDKKTPSMEKAIKTIERSNSFLPSVLPKHRSK
ncbi:MAG: DEAD/DEAH box helicase [Bacilli bacterium]|nr:DEAD/DEAH box helicase [Bacilli bacterium]